MPDLELEQRLALAARQLGGSVRKDAGGSYFLRVGYAFSLNPNDMRATFRVSPSDPSTGSSTSVSLRSRPLSPKRRRICLERLRELREFLSTPPAQQPQTLKRITAFRLWGTYELLMTLSSLLISGTFTALVAGIWLWLLGTLQILSIADRPNVSALFFGKPDPVVQAMAPAVRITTRDALGGAVIPAIPAILPLALVLSCVFFVLELLPRSGFSFLIILLLWGAYFTWFFSAWSCGATGVLVAVSLPFAAIPAYRLGWEIRSVQNPYDA